MYDFTVDAKELNYKLWIGWKTFAGAKPIDKQGFLVCGLLNSLVSCLLFSFCLSHYSRVPYSIRFWNYHLYLSYESNFIMYFNGQIDPIMKVKRSVTLNLKDFAGLLPKSYSILWSHFTSYAFPLLNMNIQMLVKTLAFNWCGPK